MGYLPIIRQRALQGFMVDYRMRGWGGVRSSLLGDKQQNAIAVTELNTYVPLKKICRLTNVSPRIFHSRNFAIGMMPDLNATGGCCV